MTEFRPLDAFRSPRFAQVPTFMRLPHHRDPRDLDVALVGIPFDGGSSYRPGARFGPREIRVQSALIRPWHPVLQVAPFERLRVADYGDIDVYAPTLSALKLRTVRGTSGRSRRRGGCRRCRT